MRKPFMYYFDYDTKEYNKIMSSDLLRNRDKQILSDLVNGMTVSELATKYNCSERTICNRRKELFEKTKQFMGGVAQLEINENNLFKTRKYSVYMLTFPNNKVYIGQTYDTKLRWGLNGRGYEQQEILYNDILKYGWDNIKKEIVYKNLSYEQSIKKEKELINKYQSTNAKFGYNKK